MRTRFSRNVPRRSARATRFRPPKWLSSSVSLARPFPIPTLTVRDLSAPGVSSAEAAWWAVATMPRTRSTRTTYTWLRSWARTSTPRPRWTGSCGWPVAGMVFADFSPQASFKGGPKRGAAPNVVLAAGVLGTVDLLLHARERGWLSELSPALGRRVRTNSEAIVGATSRRKEADFTDGIAITSSIDPDAVS